MVELLVVIALITLLMAILLAVASTVRFQANSLECASNLRQLATALIAYRSEFGGKFPPNHAGRGLLWYDQARIGKYIPTSRTDVTDVRNRVMRCPLDDAEGYRSYGMNAWASSLLDNSFLTGNIRSSEQLWHKRGKDPASVILLADAFSYRGGPVSGYSANSIIGYRGTPAQRFGAPPLMNLASGRLGTITCDLAYPRHAAQRLKRQGTKPVGRVNIAFVDGHVDLRAYEDLVNPTTNKSRLQTVWTPIDMDLDR